MSHRCPYEGGLKLNEGFHVWELGKTGWGSGRMSACQSIMFIEWETWGYQWWIMGCQPRRNTNTDTSKVTFSMKLHLVSIQGILHVLCLIRKKYSRARVASLLCAWKLLLKKMLAAVLHCPQHSARLPQDSDWVHRSSQLNRILRFSQHSHPLCCDLLHKHHSFPTTAKVITGEEK